MQRSMASVFHRDCERLGLLPGDPLIAAVDDDFPGELPFSSTVQLTPLYAETGVDCLCLSSDAGEAALDDRLAGSPEAIVCIVAVSVVNDRVAGIVRFGAISRVAEKHGFSLADIRMQPLLESSSANQIPSVRLFFERTAHAGSMRETLRKALIFEACGLHARALSVVSFLAESDPRCRELGASAYLRAARIEGFGALSPVADFCRAASTAPGWDRARYPILVSIQIQTNDPERFTQFCDRLANSCDDPTRVEVIVKIDDDHVALNELLPIEVARQPFQLKFISTPLIGGFFALWESMNDMLRITDPGAYFLLNLNDEMYFQDHGWDSRLERYVGLFPDDLYRLRTSIHKNRNYHDHWECGFAAETSAITTKRWILTGGNWNPCLGPDTFQQCVAYYFSLINRRLPEPRYREIPIDDIRFGGEGSWLGLTGKSRRRRLRGSTRAWYRLMSAEIQQDAARRAAKIHATIRAGELGLDERAVKVDMQRRAVLVMTDSGTRAAASYSFAIPLGWYRRLNLARITEYQAAGGGGQLEHQNPILEALSFLALRYDWAERIRDWVYEEAAPQLSNEAGEPARIRHRLHRTTQSSLRLAVRGVFHAPGYARLLYHRRFKHVLGVLSLFWLLLTRRIRGHTSLFYHRRVKHAFGLIDLATRRALAGAKGTPLWLAPIAWPRRIKGHISLFYHRRVKHAFGLMDLAARRTLAGAKGAPLWLAPIAWPRRVKGYVALFYHRQFKHGLGLLSLLRRRLSAHVKTMLWRVLVHGPRRVKGQVGLFYRRRVKHAFGLAALAARRTLAWVKRILWLALIGLPRRVRGSVGLFYHRDVKHALGLADLGARRSLARAKRTLWLLLNLY